MIRRLVALVVVVLAIAAFVVGEVYAGSSDALPSGQTISGVDVGGKSTQEATQMLEQKAAALAGTPVTVRVAGHTFRFRQADLGLSVDWAGAVDSVRSQSDGVGPLRGFRRLYRQLFGLTITPATDTRGGKLDRALDTIVDSVGHRPVDAKIALHGLHPVVVPGRKGVSI